MYQDIGGRIGEKLGSIDCQLNEELDSGIGKIHSEAYAQSAGEFVIKLVSTLEKTSQEAMLKPSRGKAEICLARQMAMYLMHTVFSCSYFQVAKFFKRDRTTIAHACKLVEDHRDNHDFDKRLEAMENLLVSARCLAEIGNNGANNG